MANRKDIKTITIFAGSADLEGIANKQPFIDAAKELAVKLVDNGYKDFIFGGIFTGLMEVFAVAAMEKGANVRGYIPKTFKAWAPANPRPDLDQFYKEVICKDVNSQRDRMNKDGDAAIALAGGKGLFAEIAVFDEVQYTKFFDYPDEYLTPIFAINTLEYYMGLRQQNIRANVQGFIRADHQGLGKFPDTVDQTIAQINEIRDQGRKRPIDLIRPA